MGKYVLMLAIAGAVVISGALPSTAQAYTRVDGQCGIHRLGIVPPYLHRYNIVIGYTASYPKHKCYGQWRPIIGGAQRNTLGPWEIFLPPRVFNWNWHGILDVATNAGITAGACTAFGTGIAGEFPTFTSDTAITLAAGAGCIKGGLDMAHSVNALFGIKS